MGIVVSMLYEDGLVVCDFCFVRLAIKISVAWGLLTVIVSYPAAQPKLLTAKECNSSTYDLDANYVAGFSFRQCGCARCATMRFATVTKLSPPDSAKLQ